MKHVKLYLYSIGFLFAFLISFEFLFAQQMIGGRFIKKGMWKNQEIEYVDRQIAVKVKSGAQLKIVKTLISRNNGTLIEDFDKLRWGLVELAEGKDIFHVIDSLKNNPLIESVEPNLIDHVSFNPNDPYFQDGHQWALNNTGQNPPAGTNDADVDAPEAWSITRGYSNVIIAILDTGIPMLNGSLSHPDLDDPNKFILGEDESGDGLRDLYGHGTHVTGIASAETNNSTGISGVAGGCKIMVVKVFTNIGDGSSLWFKNGVIYAVDNGAKVINYSGGGPANQQKYDAIAYANSNNVFVAASAGNDYSGPIIYPAAYSPSFPNLVAVGATDHNDTKSSYSNIGSELNIVAPGGYGGTPDANDIYSTTPNYSFYLEQYGITQNYGYMAGTSMAAPHVSGIAALVLSINSNLTPSQIRSIVEQSADDKGAAGWDQYYGYGRVNANNALKYTLEHYGGVIPAGETWNFEAGITLHFDSGCYLYVDGVLNILGTSANHVTFTRSGSSGTWGGIRFRSGSSGTIQYANISYATYGVHLTSSGSVANVQHCNFTQNTYGARIDYSDDTRFSNCNFQNNTYGIYPYYADCDIEDNTFSNNYRGIYTYHCSPALNDNEINNNTNAGIYASSYSSPQLWTICPYGSGNVNNYIHHNPTGVYCSSSATPNLGIYINRGSAAMGGFNYFLSNSSYDVSNYNSSYTVRAEVNWWEPSAKIYGSVDLSPDAEDLGFYLPKPAVAGKPDDSASELLRSAQILELDSAYADAIVQYKRIIDQYSESGIVGAALTGVERCHRKLKTEKELISYLDKLYDTYPKQFTGALALYFSGGVYARSSDYQAALNRLEEAEAVFRSLPGFPEETAWVMFDQGQICEILDSANDGTAKLARADNIYEKILKDFPDTEAAAQLKELVEFDEPPPKSPAVVINNVALLSAYPNPFNESTQIVYQISETVPVKIVLYDLLGRRVRTLVDRPLNAGINEIQWNGKDESGHPLSSGIYLCQLLAGNKFQTIKVLMAK